FAQGLRAGDTSLHLPGSQFVCQTRAMVIDLLGASVQFSAVQDNGALKKYLDSQLHAALDWLRRMVEINSYTANPEGVNRLARLTCECFAPLGFTPEFVPASNPEYGSHLVLNRPGKSGRTIAMVSHLDTVFPPEEEVRNNFRW